MSQDDRGNHKGVMSNEDLARAVERIYRGEEKITTTMLVAAERLRELDRDAARWRMALRKASYYSIDKDYLVSPEAPGRFGNCAADMTAGIDEAIAREGEADES